MESGGEKWNCKSKLQIETEKLCDLNWREEFPSNLGRTTQKIIVGFTRREIGRRCLLQPSISRLPLLGQQLAKILKTLFNLKF